MILGLGTKAHLNYAIVITHVYQYPVLNGRSLFITRILVYHQRVGILEKAPMSQQPRPYRKVYFSRVRSQSSHPNATPESELYGLSTISRLTLISRPTMQGRREVEESESTINHITEVVPLFPSHGRPILLRTSPSMDFERIFQSYLRHTGILIRRRWLSHAFVPFQNRTDGNSRARFGRCSSFGY